ncbi:hypothetical protein Ahy_A09g042563 isoform B [Arachis hypogaea]|uniref:PGG domain-containing protein n=1 Tax=Arachis hypogaea TaxID=3818 RepID=A0A445BGE1_ARAHY|nr:hypothetical protein Ahy_A09g042563 isoform B [Arachis hypogaea]
MEGPKPVSAAQGSASRNPDETEANTKKLLEAVRRGDLDETLKLAAVETGAIRAEVMTHWRGRALHIALTFGHLHIVDKLVQLMSPNDLELATDSNTVLCSAVLNKDENFNISAAKCIVSKHDRLLTLPTPYYWIPVTWAVELGHNELARYLYSVTPFHVLRPENGKYGADLLVRCYYSKMFDVAVDLLRRCPRLAMRNQGQGAGDNLLLTLAKAPSSSLDQIQFHLGKDGCMKVNVAVDLVRDCPKLAMRDNKSKFPSWKRWLYERLLLGLVRNIDNLLGIKKIREAKLGHQQYLALLRATCRGVTPLNDKEIQESGIRNAIFEAAKRGNAVFIVEALKVHFTLYAIHDEKGGAYFPSLWSIVKQTAKPFLSTSIDYFGNSMLHMAGMLAPPIQLSPIPGALLQMQRELHITTPMIRERLNDDNLTPRALFTEQHTNLVKEGEKWTKETASSCGVVAALVATITFSAAFTVPGGNDQSKGYPIFLHKKLFLLFIILDAVSLFSSTTSLLMFLGLLTSRYAEDDFLKSLPTKLMIGLSTMFISLATMMAAFCASLFLMLQNRSWIVIPVTLLASVPLRSCVSPALVVVGRQKKILRLVIVVVSRIPTAEEASPGRSTAFECKKLCKFIARNSSYGRSPYSRRLSDFSTSDFSLSIDASHPNCKLEKLAFKEQANSFCFVC